MEKKRKYKSLIKSLILCDLQTYIFSFYAFLFFISLSDAEVLKDISKYFICSDFSTCNFSQMEEAFT